MKFGNQTFNSSNSGSFFSSVQIWLDASSGTWVDKSGNGRNPTLGAGSLQFTTAPNGLSAVNATGTEYWNIYLDWMSGTPHAVYAAIKPITYNNLYGAASGGSGNNSAHIGWSDSSTYRMNHWGNDFYPPYSFGSNWHISTWCWGTGGNKRVFTNGSLKGQTNGGTMLSTMSGGGRILNVVSQGIMQCYIGELVFVSGNQTDDNLYNGYVYLKRKWGL
jgi:hypothetical protein